MKAKQIIFNVGAGLCSYFETEDKKILFDLGRSSNFCPVSDFMLPLFESRQENKNQGGKYIIDQLIISHPHNDHISAIEDFDKLFHAGLVTVPNDNEGMSENDKLNWNLIDNKTQDLTKYLRNNVIKGRTPPLRSSALDRLFIYWIPPKECESNPGLENKNYSNNVSLAVFLIVNGHRIFLPGDLMKDGMEFIVKRNSGLRNQIEKGVDYLVAPHHGLRSSFSEYLFKHFKDSKTRCLNIVSETVTSEESDRIVDARYSSSDYCSGENNLSTSTESVFQRKTSNGHIIIDYSTSVPNVKVIATDAYDELIDHFL